MNRFIRYTILLSLITFSFNSFAATLSSTVNRNQVSTNETLTLTVTIDQQVDTSSLDLSELEVDFEVLSRSPQSRNSINIVNGRSVQESTTVWTITLVAKRDGLLTIPAFNIGAAKSEAITIDVSNAKNTPSSNLPLDVKVSSNRSTVYPNQQFIVTVELSAQRDVRDLSGPQILVADADVEPLDQQNFQRVDNGIARQIVILKYAVFAKKSGKLTIPVLTYTGLKNARRSVFGNTGDQVIARSNQLELEVLDPPISNSNQAWFSADDVSITSKWSTDIANLNVGQPVTRTITIIAQGQHASAIPPISGLTSIDGVKSYKDQPQLETGKTSEGYFASRIESEALVATKAGEFTLPRLSIKWWSNETESWQTATLEAETLQVTGSTLPINETQSSTAQSEFSPPTNASPELQHSPLDQSKAALPWQILSGVLGMIILFQFFVLRKQNNSSLLVSAEKPSFTMEKSAWTKLERSIKNGEQINLIREAILHWANSLDISSERLTLSKLAEIGDSRGLSESLEAIDRALYQAGGEAPAEHLLDDLRLELASFRSMVKPQLDKDNDDNSGHRKVLKPLYPTS